MRRKALSLLGATALLAAGLSAQQAPIPHHLEGYSLDSGRHNGPAAGPTAAARPAFRETVQIAGAPWLRLHFGPTRLSRGSFLVLTSKQDGARQILDAASLEAWSHTSAFFNGGEVDVELRVGPGARGDFVQVQELMVGEEGPALSKTICGATDDRVASNDPGVGRIVPIGCTGWVVSNGANLTAGHCAGASLQTFQFNVPLSLPNGTIQHPPPQDQYPVVAGSVLFVDGGIGNDWAVFAVQPNANTGRLPVHVYGAFFRMSKDTAPATVRVTGYGVDSGSANQTQQTHAGPFTGETVSSASRVSLNYRADTTGGNSGSPVIADANTVLTVGIHTHGGCTSSGGANAGTSFENDSLESAVQSFPGASFVYVDLGHPVNLEDGTVLRPFDTVTEGTNTVLNGGTVSIVRGDYDVPPLTLNRPMTLRAPVGLVRIH